MNEDEIPKEFGEVAVDPTSEHEIYDRRMELLTEILSYVDSDEKKKALVKGGRRAYRDRRQSVKFLCDSIVRGNLTEVFMWAMEPTNYLNVVDINGRNPLITAIKSGYEQIIFTLLVCGADPSAYVTKRELPLAVVIRSENRDIVRAFERGLEYMWKQ